MLHLPNGALGNVFRVRTLEIPHASASTTPCFGCAWPDPEQKEVAGQVCNGRQVARRLQKPLYAFQETQLERRPLMKAGPQGPWAPQELDQVLHAARMKVQGQGAKQILIAHVRMRLKRLIAIRWAGSAARWDSWSLEAHGPTRVDSIGLRARAHNAVNRTSLGHTCHNVLRTCSQVHKMH